MPYGYFAGDDDNPLGSTYGTVGFIGDLVTDVAASGYTYSLIHWCAVTDYTYVECWGYNGYGALGDGSRTNSYLQPVRVQGLPAGKVSALSLGYFYSCAMVDGRDSPGGYGNSTVWCWGYNNVGQLGDDSVTLRAAPVMVQGLPGNVTSIDAEYSHACALVDGGEVYCWGEGTKGELGNGAASDSTTAVKVRGLEDVVVTQMSTGECLGSFL
jgi:alpha-tubulin suppressor-like RCC1 family protein